MLSIQKIVGASILLILVSCNKSAEQKKDITKADESVVGSYWVRQDSIELSDVEPVGLLADGDKLYVSDGNGGALIEIDLNNPSAQPKVLLSMERPMHFDRASTEVKMGEVKIGKDEFIIPSYANDELLMYPTKKTFPLNTSLDAPSAVAVSENSIAIADFYNHRVVLIDQDGERIIGSQGSDNGQFNYPTDVQFYKGQLFVADAYNNRVQVFDEYGKFVKIIAADEGINAAIGLYAGEYGQFITDFENGRVIIYNSDGEKHEELSVGGKPIDVYEHNGKLFVADFANRKIKIFSKKIR